jgi:micrococcal nuclease
MIAAATCNAFYTVPSEKVETGQVVRLLLTEKEVSEVPATLVEIIDGDTIKVFVNGKIETVRYLLIDTPESKSPKNCIQFYAKEEN